MMQTTALKTSPPSEKYRKLGMVAQKNVNNPQPSIFHQLAMRFFG